MRFRKLVLVLGLTVVSIVAAAQSTMTDIQVLDYVKNGAEQGKSRQEMLAELAARGVTREQATLPLRSSNSRAKVCLIWFAAGFLLSCFWVLFGEDLWKKMIAALKE